MENIEIIKNTTESIFNCPVHLYAPCYESGDEWHCAAGLKYTRLQLLEVVAGCFLDISEFLPKVKRFISSDNDETKELPLFWGPLWDNPTITRKGIFCLVVDSKEVDKNPERVAYLWKQ